MARPLRDEFWPLMWPYRFQLYVLFFATIWLTVVSLAPIHIVKEIGKDVVAHADIEVLGQLCVGLLMLGLLEAMLAYVHKRYFINLEEKFIYDLRLKLFHKALRLPLRLHQSLGSAAILSRTMKDAYFLQKFLVEVFFEALTSLAIIGWMFIYLASLDWNLTIVTLCVLPLYLAAYFPFHKRISMESKHTRETYDSIVQDLEETVLGIQEVQVFATEVQESREFGRNLYHFEESVIALEKTKAKSKSAMVFAGNVGLVAVLFYGGWQVHEGVIGVGGLMAFILVVKELIYAGKNLFNFFKEYSEIRPIIYRISELLGMEEQSAYRQIASGELTESLRRPDAQSDILDPDELFSRVVSVQNVSFTYSNGTKALREVSVDFKRGEAVAIVGPSGSGKTTLFHLLLGMYDLQEGNIYFDDRPITDIPQDLLRNSISIVNQRPFIWQKSLRENLLYGARNANVAQIQEACTLANIDREVLGFALQLDMDDLLHQEGASWLIPALDHAHQLFKERIENCTYSPSLRFVGREEFMRPTIYDLITRYHDRWERHLHDETYVRKMRTYLDDVMVESLQESGLYETLFQLALDYQVGQRGSNLSEGQIRRLAIVRALLREAPLLLLDEPTAGVDREDVRKIEETILRLVEDTGRTILFITHDFSITKRADRVLVFNRGYLREAGTHEELIHNEGLYAEMYHNQFGSLMMKKEEL